MTIRQHLTRLEGEGLIGAETERQPTGRPAHVYRLTAKGDDLFPKAYDRLARLLLEAALEADVAGPAPAGARTESAQAMPRLARRAAAAHSERLEHLQGRARVEAALAILQEESGFVEVDETANGVDIRDYNCVYRQVAEANSAVCAFHTEYVSCLTGAPVELTTNQCQGADACCFRVSL